MWNNLILVLFSTLYTLRLACSFSNFDTLSKSLSDVWMEVNELIETPVITVDDCQHRLEFFLGGDMKVCIHACILNICMHALPSNY